MPEDNQGRIKEVGGSSVSKFVAQRQGGSTFWHVCKIKGGFQEGGVKNHLVVQSQRSKREGGRERWLRRGENISYSGHVVT